MQKQPLKDDLEIMDVFEIFKIKASWLKPKQKLWKISVKS